MPPSSITCAPTIGHRLRNRIRKGKFVDFDRLLLVDSHKPPSLQYSSVDDATTILSRLGKGALVDLKSAFSMVPVHRHDWELLGIHWRRAYYVDTCLPFGLRSARYLFNQFAEALQWILQNIL